MRSRAGLWRLALRRIPGEWRTAAWLLALTASLGHAESALGPNLALHQPVVSSGPNWGSFKPAALTDGDPQTFTHPLAATGTTGFYFEVDLGRVVDLEQLRLRNRADGCCTERLSHFRVEVWSDSGGGDRQRVWSASFRADGSHTGVAGVEVLEASADPTGVFAGRYVRVVNEGGDAYSPQLAEIEAYGAPPPRILRFEAADDTLARGEPTTLRWEVSGADAVFLSPGELAVSATNDAFVVTPTTTTRYTLVARHQGSTSTADLTVGVDVALAPPALVEFVATNDGSRDDEDGEASDWVELYNPNPYRLNLEGYFLTDDPANLRQWRFPAARLLAGERRVVFASGKDRTNATRELHTNFRLAADGDYLALVDRDGTRVLGQFPSTYPSPAKYPRQLAGSSYGVGVDGGIGFFPRPTPGAENGTAFPGVVRPVDFGIERGVRTESLALLLATETPDATIRYTLDGSEPTAARGLRYTTLLNLTNTVVVRAAAFRDGWAPSRVTTHTYLFPERVAESSVMRRTITTDPRYRDQIPAALRDLPSVSLATATAANDTTTVRASMEWLPADGTPTAQADAGVVLYGGAFTDFAKKNFRLSFRREFGPSKFSYPFFAGFERGVEAVGEFDQLELRGGSHDMSQRGFYLGNVFADDTLLEMGHLSPHGRFVHLYLNGVYWGVYHLRERWGAAMHARYLGGTPEDYESINGNWNVGGWAEPGVPYDGDGTRWEWVKSHRTSYREIRDWLDVPDYVDFMTMWMFGGAEDEYRCVGGVRPGNGFKFYLNDADGWFCIPAYCAATDRTARSTAGRQAGDGPGSLFSALFREADPEYRTLLADRMQQSLGPTGPLSTERNLQRLLRRATEFEHPHLAESARWGFLSPTEWRRRLDSVLTTWLPRRTLEVTQQFRTAGFLPNVPAPSLDPAGGELAPGTPVRLVSGGPGTTWYTLDGTDPRQPDAGVAASARAANATSLTFTQATWVRARTLDRGTWSPLMSAFFTLRDPPESTGQVAVTQFKVTPSRDDATEFLELGNPSSAAVSLRGARFTDGLRFAFADTPDQVLAPGQRWVLVRDLIAFRERYGTDVAVHGVYLGRLNSSGDSLEITAATNGLPLLRFRYGTSGIGPEVIRWPETAWVFADPDLGPESPLAWRPNRAASGTPGMPDSLKFVGAPGQDADRDGWPAFVEYAFGTDDENPFDAAAAWQATWDPNDGAQLELRRALGADDARVRVEFSTDLIHWQPATGRVLEKITHGFVHERWTMGDGEPPPNSFLRVRVETRAR